MRARDIKRTVLLNPWLQDKLYFYVINQFKWSIPVILRMA
jgi:hypothetical protein